MKLMKQKIIIFFLLCDYITPTSFFQIYSLYMYIISTYVYDIYLYNIRIYNIRIYNIRIGFFTGDSGQGVVGEQQLVCGAGLFWLNSRSLLAQ
jgi:hypothetical protein